MDAGAPSADEKILLAAMRCIAVGGPGATLRTIAEEAGVSAGLIIHHFGSRAGLLEACDRRALEVIRAEKSAVVTGGAPEMLLQLAEAERFAPLAGFLLRRLQSGGDLARQLLEDFERTAEGFLAEGVAAGTITPSRDPRSRARMLTRMSLGALLLHLPGEHAPMDLEDLPRWLREHLDTMLLPLLELYTTPLLTDASMLEAALEAAPPSDTTAPTTRSSS